MNPYEQFDVCLKNSAKEFRNVDKKEVIRVISHLDADGISSCSILLKMLNNLFNCIGYFLPSAIC